MNIQKILEQFKGTTFHENYRVEDWLLHRLTAIEKEQKDMVDEMVKKKHISQDVEDCYAPAEYEDIIKEGWNKHCEEIIKISKKYI